MQHATAACRSRDGRVSHGAPPGSPSQSNVCRWNSGHVVSTEQDHGRGRRVRTYVRRQQLSARNVHTATRRLISAAVGQLDARPLSDTNVHEARKAIKKARATLRLLRNALPAATYRRENEALRNAARPLSATRDAKVLIDALDALAARNTIDQKSAAAFGAS